MARRNSSGPKILEEKALGEVVYPDNPERKVVVKEVTTPEGTYVEIKDHYVHRTAGVWVPGSGRWLKSDIYDEVLDILNDYRNAKDVQENAS